MASILEPGSYRAEGVADDAAIIGAMIRVELAWVRALAATGAGEPQQVAAVEQAVAGWQPQLASAAIENAANPVLPLLEALRDRISDPETAALVHAGLTSQDVLDTALMLVSRDALRHIEADLLRTSRRLSELATTHRDSVMAGRTLTQYAVPITFGLKAAQWLVGIVDAVEAVRAVKASLPVQCGGAAGTLARVGERVDHPLMSAASFADQLGLAWPGMSWHTRRTPVTSLADTLVQCCDACGVIAGNALNLGRPEVDELREGSSPGRGASSTMPHKRNPVLSVLIRSAALQAPALSMQLHVAAASYVDERPDGAWHAEWASLRRLLELTVTATAQTADLVEGLEVNVAAMAKRAEHAADQLTSERSGTGDVSTYLGESEAFVHAALDRYRGVLNGDA